jgi:V/A-type H+-transporting ATPase subunit B
MNAAIRLYADAANAKTKLENGFDLTDYDERTMKFAKEYSDKFDINIEIDAMLITAWELLNKYFSVAEIGIKSELVEKYGKRKDD